MQRIYIDGQAGTTGLRIAERLKGRSDLTLITLPDERRRDITAREAALNLADVVILCLPDDAAREAVTLVKNPETVIIDASTAHRIAPGWIYGFPELGKIFRESIQQSKRIAVPGCHASGFIALTRPLVESNCLSPKEKISCFSITGYTGGGKEMIAQYEAPERFRGDPRSAPLQYALNQSHKHLPEMQKYSGFSHAPVFSPIVADFDCGMEVCVPLPNFLTKKEQIMGIYEEYYGNELAILLDDSGNFPEYVNSMKGRDDMILSVEGCPGRLVLRARFDNLGKGASGAAIQCLNLSIDANEFNNLEVSS